MGKVGKELVDLLKKRLGLFDLLLQFLFVGLPFRHDYADEDQEGGGNTDW